MTKLFSIAFCLALSSLSSGVEATFAPSISRYGTPKYDLTKPLTLDYLNASAPKGGKIRIGTVGTFDSLNMFTVSGVAVEGLTHTHAPLMRRLPGDPFSRYACIAESAEVAPDFSKVTFKMNKQATFHDGSPITAEDIAFTVKLLMDKGWPRYKQSYGKIANIIITDPHTITFELKPNDKGEFDPELPLILSLLQPLHKKSLEKSDFTATHMTPLIGSGPYKIKTVEPGHHIVYERIKNHWTESLSTNKGAFNFDEIEIFYTKNTATHFQEFLTGNLDIYFEQDPNQWNTRYDIPQVNDGRITRIALEHQMPVVVRTLAFNMKNPLFEHLKVRQALDLAFDFETLNKMVFYGSLKRVKSLFENTPLAHQGAANDLERRLLSPHMVMIQDQISKGELPENILEEPYIPPHTNGDGNQRDNLAKADELLKQAGWTIKNGRRVNAKGEVFTFEFLIKDPRFEKIALGFQRSLKALGIHLKVRLVDTVQYEGRVTERNWDMIVHSWSNTLSPGVEQAYYFSRHTADIKGSSNYIGVKDPLIEALAVDLSRSKTSDELTAYVHNLDRFVMRKNYMIPLSYSNTSYTAYYGKRIAFPKPTPLTGINVIETGWAIQGETAPETSDHTTHTGLWNRLIVWIKSFF